MGNKYSNIRINFKLWMNAEDGEYILGDDTFNLLKGIKGSGSLSASANNSNISYRKAWGDLKKCEEKLGFALSHKERGGKNGGRTLLTEEGERLLDAYENLHESFKNSVNEVIIDFKRTIKGKN